VDKPRIVIGTWHPKTQEKREHIKTLNKQLEEGYRYARRSENLLPPRQRSARKQRYETYDLQTFRSNRRLRRSPRSHKGKWIPTLSAVATGVVLGLSVLWLLPDDRPPFLPLSTVEEKPQQAPVIDGKDAQFQLPAASSSEGKIVEGQGYKLSLQPVYLVQAGVFNDMASAKVLLDQQQKQGWSGVVTKTAPYSVYVGVSPVRDEALAIASFYKNKGLDVYVKEWKMNDVMIPASDISQSQNLSQTVSAFEQLFQKLAAVSATALSQKPIDQSAIDQLKQAHQTWLADVDKLPDSSRNNAVFKELVTRMNQAVQNVLQYQSSPDPAIAWQEQNDLIAVLLEQEQWVNSLAKE
jgi:hypothetical protein